MKNISKEEARVTPDLPGQARQQPPDLRFCRAWWEFKKALYPKLGNAALRVFLVLEDRASRWNNYHVPMSLATLGEETGVRHHTTLAAGIRELEAAEIISVTRHAGNSRQANIYALLIRELIGGGREVFRNRSDSGSNSGGKCDCAGTCQIVADNADKDKADNADKDKKDSSVSVSQGSDNCSQFNSEVNSTIKINEKSQATSNSKITTNASICSNRNSQVISVAASANATSAKTELLTVPESASADSGSAKTDTVLPCTTTTKRINWFNPNGLNGDSAAKIQPVKAKLTQRQGENGRPEENQLGVVPVNSAQVQLQVQDSATDVNFEAKSYSHRYSFQPQNQMKNQNRNSQQLREEYFKRLSWAANSRERMNVLFSALRLAFGQALGKAEFSGIQALANEYGCKGVLTGILATVGRIVGKNAYFAYLKVVLRGQFAEQTRINHRGNFGVTRKSGNETNSTLPHRATTLPYSSNYPINKFPIDLAKYTGNGKYAYRAASHHSYLNQI